MAEKTVSLKIKAAPTSDTKKSLDQLKQVSTQWDKTFGKDGGKPVKEQVNQIRSLTQAWRDLGGAIKGVRDNFRSGFDVGSRSLAGVKAFTSGIEGATKKVLNLKNAIAATAIGGAAIWGIKAIFEQGTGQQRNLKRVRREFGDEAGQFIDIGNKVGLRSGIQGDDAAAALVPLGEQLQAIQKGAQFRGMKKPLTEAQAAALRAKNLAFGGNLLERIQTLSPDIDPETLGRVLGDSLAGPEGIKSLIGTLHLSKRSKLMSAANEKGEAFKALTPAEQKRLGITKKGQYLEQGDLVNLLLERSGMTDQAAADERKTFGFQAKSIRAQFMDTLGDIGSSALDKMNEKLGKGKTLAESLHDYLASKDGQKTIEGITNSVVKITEGIVTIATKLPAIASWLSEHKLLLGGIAGIYGAAKVAPTVVGLAKGVGSLVGGARGATPLTPLFVNVVNGAGGSIGGVGGKLGGAAGKAGLVIGAGVAGYELGSYLDEKFGLSDKIAGGGQEDKGAEARNRNKIKFLAERRKSLIAALEGSGVDHGHAVLYADRPDLAAQQHPELGGIFKSLGIAQPDINVTTNLVVDGQVLAKVAEKHITRNIKDRTANGAAPVSRQ